MNPLVTVLMSVYNGEKYLERAIKSILNQTFKDFEFLIINDGSTDNSVKIIQSFNDLRLRLIHNESNIGLIKTLNKGLKLSNGKYIARMDCDDISLPKRLSIQASFMEKYPEIGVCGSWVKIIGLGKKFINKYFKNTKKRERIFCSTRLLLIPPLLSEKIFLKNINLNTTKTISMRRITNYGQESLSTPEYPTFQKFYCITECTPKVSVRKILQFKRTIPTKYALNCSKSSV